MDMSDNGRIEIEKVTKIFRREDEDIETLTALDDVSLNIRSGEFVSIVGASGCGKSTLLRIIAGLETPTIGEVRKDGETIKGTDEKRGLVFQDHSLYPWLSVWDNVTFGLKSLGRYKEKKEYAGQLLEMVGLSGFSKSYPSQLSGGMSQRIALIRALVTEPDVLLLDEPLGALDAFTRMNIQDVLIDLWKETKSTMLLITHDVDEAIYLSQRVVVMTPRPGRIVDEFDIEMSYPRERSHSQFVEYRNKILKKLNYAHEQSIGYYI
jgi:ABC-type nitrate/sulfonate/bicarbonate transport system ATPase subunit